MDLSIIIVNWNTKQLLDDCLQSVFFRLKRISYEIIVIDNASSDGSPDMVAKKFKKAKLIENRANVGFAGANNQGIRIAKGKYILLLNSDTIIKDDSLYKMYAFIQKDPTIGVVGCRLIGLDGQIQGSFGSFPNIRTLFIEAFRLYKFFPFIKFNSTTARNEKGLKEPIEVDYVSGACLLVSKETIKKAGDMDEGFFAYYEETDWCFRIKQAGFKVYHLPGSIIIHIKNQSVANIPDRGLKILRRSMIRYFRKRYPHPILFPMISLLILLWYFPLKLRNSLKIFERHSA